MACYKNVLGRFSSLVTVAGAIAVAASLSACGSSSKCGTNTPDAGAPDADDSDAANDSASGDGGGSLTVPNVGAVDFGGTGDVVITAANATIDVDQGKISGASSTTADYKFMEVEQGGGAPMLAVFVAHSFRIEASALARVDGARPVVLVALDKIEVFGTLSAAGQRADAVAGGAVCTTAGKGGGPGGGGALLSYNAAAGGSFCGLGGAGNALPGQTAGIAGPAYGTATLVPLLGGSSGGGEMTFAGGGAGGGAIQLVAGGTITVGIAGIVDVSGGGGGGNGCGGGSGGALLIQAPTVMVAGILAANGGGGASFTGGPYGQNGQPGAIAASGGSATSGKGSAGAVVDGTAGTMTPGDNNSSGSGGGGAGRIVINTASGAADVTGTISPDATTACFTQAAI